MELGGENIGCLRGWAFGGPRSPAVQHEDDIFSATAAAPHRHRCWLEVLWDYETSALYPSSKTMRCMRRDEIPVDPAILNVCPWEGPPVNLSSKSFYESFPPVSFFSLRIISAKKLSSFDEISSSYLEFVSQRS